MSEQLNELKMFMENIQCKVTDMLTWFDSVPTLILIGNDSDLLRINHRWAEVLGYSVDNIVDWEWISYIHPHDIEPTIKTFENLTDDGYYSLYNRYRKINDEYIWISWEGKLKNGIHYSSGRVIRDEDPINEVLSKISKQREIEYSKTED